MIKSGIWKILLNRWSAMLHDLVWIPVGIFLAFWLRFNLGEVPPQYLARAWQLGALALPVQGVLFWHYGLYRGVWRFASMPDLLRILKAVLIGTLILSLAGMVLFRLEDVPRSVLLLYPLMLTIGLSGPRFVYRLFKDNRLQLNRHDGQRALIIGAGSAGESLVRDLVRGEAYYPAAFVDDDSTKHGREIHGIRVVGNLKDLETVVRRLDIEVVLLAIPSAGRNLVKRVVHECNAIGIPCRTLPSLTELADKPIDVGHLRPFTIDDLLGREAVKLDTGSIAGYLHNRVILVTGGGGSIGSELCRQVARLQPKQLVVYEHGEFNLYAIEQELRTAFPTLALAVVLGDVKNVERVDWAFKTFKPSVVFHAAAYKHVPMLEVNPAEGVFNNVTGTMVVADAAERFGVERFVMVSTDKAVNPANVMGATKRIAELYCQNLNSRSETRFITTRFGNVLGSTGSVVPLFTEQIRRGGPVTVTHPEISRYFMTIPEAVSLILQAGAMGEGGEIFVLDMGEPVLIRDLAEQMIRLSGLEPEIDIHIRYIGLRPGEKLHEEVFHEKEGLMGTEHPKLMLAASRQVEWGWLQTELADLDLAARSRDVELLVQHLKNLVPEYTGLPDRKVQCAAATDEEDAAVRLRVIK